MLRVGGLTIIFVSRMPGGNGLPPDPILENPEKEFLRCTGLGAGGPAILCSAATFFSIHSE